jgi:hypothetical protein
VPARCPTLDLEIQDNEVRLEPFNQLEALKARRREVQFALAVLKEIIVEV